MFLKIGILNKNNFTIGVRLVRLVAIFLFFVSSLIHSHAKGENAVVKATTDTNQIRIGEQFRLNLSATFSPGTKIGFPMLPDTFNHFEVVSKTGIDTATTAGSGRLTLMQQLMVTAFDTGFFVIPPFPFSVTGSDGNSDTLLTEAMLMTVRTVVVDTTKDIRAIKNIVEVPFPWQEYLVYILLLWIVAAIILFVYNKFFRKKKQLEVVSKVPDRPAHEIALEGLRKIEEAKLWQQGFTKKYYSQVTDVIRQYIERRFSTNAMEQTTDEILNYFSKATTREEENEKLGFMLRLADMVKFAKAQPLPSENETTLQYAFSFVENTRPSIKEDFEKEEVVK